MTKIEWCEETWNPITGCTPVSDGCKNCYARRMSHRLKGRYGYPKDDPFRITFHPDKLTQPLQWKKPKIIFVCSMGDLFHENAPHHSIDLVFEVMTKYANHHTYLILTKRPENIPPDRWHSSWNNIWLGVSFENQKTADERIPILLNIPAVKRFVSIEPMIAPINLNKSTKFLKYQKAKEGFSKPGYFYRPWLNLLDWIIVGGESGPNARCMHPDWVRSIQDQCQEANVPFFFKSWGEWLPEDQWNLKKQPWEFYYYCDKYFYWRKVGKKNSGRLLDGKIWDEYPL